jgi:hypothetical protein
MQTKATTIVPCACTLAFVEIDSIKAVWNGDKVGLLGVLEWK